MLLRRIALDALATSPVLWQVGVVAPRLFPGSLLHMAALWATWEGAFPQAAGLYEAAARCYQARLDLVPLARLRVHQAMARARASANSARGTESFLDVERRLSRLEHIEAPWPPFALVNASSLLASWTEDEHSEADAGRAGAPEQGMSADRAA